jgi:hypothetical protein
MRDGTKTFPCTAFNNAASSAIPRAFALNRQEKRFFATPTFRSESPLA